MYIEPNIHVDLTQVHMIVRQDGNVEGYWITI